MQKLILIRGLPGSGKSTLAKQQPAIHLEADMFFIKDGVYCYDPALIKQAHQWCQNQTAAALRKKLSVVVSNTFIEWWQIEPYIYLAKQQGVMVKLLEAKGNYQNIHAVPDAVLHVMKNNYESHALIMAKIKKIEVIAHEKSSSLRAPADGVLRKQRYRRRNKPRPATAATNVSSQSE
jgi:predicted kinase